ncbi:cytochrome-c peroxidase [Rurimicrobium arvi]|uniref:Cytochrome c peroxidase n=1 Tax=Rurimicrobium arvi TaxID=2049916 RepID=A0ABP8N0T4_9BACT
MSVKKLIVLVLLTLLIGGAFSFKPAKPEGAYHTLYRARMDSLHTCLSGLLRISDTIDYTSEQGRDALKQAIRQCRIVMKRCDIWLRYMEPLAQKQINGPLPVEWETEVFEKFEKPYRREGAGLLLAEQYLDGELVVRDTFRQLIARAVSASQVYLHDSILQRTAEFDHFLFCNRLHLLNLASLYTTGFENADPGQVIPELHMMMSAMQSVYQHYNETYPSEALSGEYIDLYRRAVSFVSAQPGDITLFDHYTFLRDYINPLYRLNAKRIRETHAVSHSTLDYALNKTAESIFDKQLYEGQSVKGIYVNVTDEDVLAKIDKVGKLLFFDPILSGNGERSCASCHKSDQFFTDTTAATPEQFDHKGFLSRNAPSLINAQYNHLAMADGSHITLQDQTVGVLTNPDEMSGNVADIVSRVLSCAEYRRIFESLLPYTPHLKTVSIEHISSALTYYYGKFSEASAPFDLAMDQKTQLHDDARKGFNLFMGKAQCATCHFVPQFNGVKPPFIGSEFEVLGTPSDKAYAALSKDPGRYKVNPAPETMHAFRTGSLRNSMHTAPYMHNGVFRSMDEVIDFYDFGGGQGHGLDVPNQTLSADSLHLTANEKQLLKAFLHSLTESVQPERAPHKLPVSADNRFKTRIIGGRY